jgi:propanol-preferring alcohol dehydrogenase
MKAWITREQAEIVKEPMELTNIPTPHPKGDEIRIKVTACGICRTDLHIVEGDLPLKKSPIVTGHEVVGMVDEIGDTVKKFKRGDQVGVTWLHSTCGRCKHCLSGRANYCPEYQCTGWHVNGGFAEYMTIREDFALSLQGVDMAPEDIAPLLCPGVAGYFAFKLADLKEGDKLGLYGFGPTAYYVLKVANYLGIECYVSTRSKHNIESARKQGAVWADNAMNTEMPEMLDAAVIFPPAGRLVEPTLAQVKQGGKVVLAPVDMTLIEIKDYSNNLWGRDLLTLYNVKHSASEEFLRLATKIDLAMDIKIVPFEKVQDAMIQLKQGKIKESNTVVKMPPPER